MVGGRKDVDVVQPVQDARWQALRPAPHPVLAAAAPEAAETARGHGCRGGTGEKRVVRSSAESGYLILRATTMLQQSSP